MFDNSKRRKPNKWENTDKEQISLAMGSAEYKERVRDLQEVSPDRPDDKFHTEREKNLEVQASDVALRNQKMDERNDTAERKYRNQTSKRVQFDDVKDSAIETAAETETPVDDIKAKRMLPKTLDNIVYDDGVTEDDYLPTVLKKYL